MGMVNYLAVLVAAIVSFVIGGIWYSKSVFGAAWQKEVKTGGDMKGASSAMVVQFIALLVAAYVLARSASHYSTITFGGGLWLGFWVWLGFVATTTIGGVLFEKKSWNWFWLLNGYNLISLMIMGAIVSAWK